MENPARELVEIIDGWACGGGRAAPAARAEYARKRDLTESQVVHHAMACLVEIAERIEGLRGRGFDVSPFISGLPRWQSSFMAAASTQQAAAAGARRAAIPGDQLDLLKSLALVMDTSAAGVMPRPSAVVAVEEAIDEAEAFVRAADVTDDVRDYLLRLLGRIRSALRNGRGADLRSAVNEYVGATVILEQSAPDGEKSGWANARAQLLYPILAGAGGNMLSSAVLLLAAANGQS